MTESVEKAGRIQAARTNQALGIFLLFFGAVVLISIVFTETTVGKFTNFTAGGIIAGIGLTMIIRARKILSES